MPNRSRYILFVTLLFVALSSLFVPGAAAQSAGVVTGRVVDASDGAPLPGANVRVQDADIGVSANERGRYQIQGLSPGTHTLVVSFVGFEPVNETVEVDAGETTEANVALESRVLESGEVVVTGLREGQVRSINQKRQALNIIDAISADEAGRLPDLNVAESTQRLPGVTLRTDRGEGRFVSIRGTSPNRNNVTFNGQAMASSAGTRATALDLVPAEMISSVQVSKAVTPDMDPNALGGSVNINTLTAFDRAGSFVTASLNGMQHQETTGFGDTSVPFRGSVTAGTQFGSAEQWGLVVSGAASRRDFKTSISSPNSWTEVDGRIVPEELELEVEDNDRMRYSANANLDHRPTASTTAYLRLHHSQRDESFTNTEVQYDADEVEPTSATAGRMTFQSELDIPSTDIDERLYAVTLGGEQQIGSDVTVELDGTYSRGERDRFTHQPEWGFDQDFTASYEHQGEQVAVDLDNPDAVTDPSNYQFDEMDIEFEELRENTWQLSTDVRWNYEAGKADGFFKSGAQARLRDKDIDENENPWANGSTPFTLADYGIHSPISDPLTGGDLTGNTQVPVSGNTSTFLDFWDENRNSEFFSLDDVESREEEVERDAEVTEDVYAGYLMGNVQLGSLAATGGVRIEATETTSDRYQFVDDQNLDDAVISETNSSNQYVNVLPSLHLTYQLTPQLQLRGAWSNTIGRPDYQELSAFQDVEFEERRDDVWEASINEGNPNLDPYRATNVDLTAEYYWGDGGLISVGGFYKHIRNPIYEFEVTERNLEGRELGVEIQDIPGFDDRFFEEVNYEQLRNADSGNIWGFEASIQQFFNFLPSPLDGLGLASNVALMNSDVTVPDREDEDLPFFDQSDLTYNVIPFYQLRGFELRYALNYQGEYLTSVGADAFEDSYGDERLTMDVSARYTLWNERVQVNAYVRNLTNERVRSYQGRKTRTTFHELTGRTFELGVTTRL
jgi:TonB-dependent receptor